MSDPAYRPVSSLGYVLQKGRQHNAGIETMLTERGIKFPLCGYEPGQYMQTCMTCGSNHDADKRATQCLPCAVVQAMEKGETAQGSAFDAGKRAGRTGLLDEIRKLAEVTT